MRQTQSKSCRCRTFFRYTLDRQERALVGRAQTRYPAHGLPRRARARRPSGTRLAEHGVRVLAQAIGDDMPVWAKGGMSSAVPLCILSASSLHPLSSAAAARARVGTAAAACLQRQCISLPPKTMSSRHGPASDSEDWWSRQAGGIAGCESAKRTRPRACAVSA